jgi:aminoglycoside phosphotransferase (APT) family kinase protein
MTSTAAPPAIDDALLAYLRRSLNNDGVAFAAAPERLTAGFEALTYAFELSGAPPEFARPLILRVFNDRHPDGHAAFEAAIQNVASDQGFPTARVLLVGSERETLGGEFIVMERLSGVSVVELLKNPVNGRRVARMLADLHAQLHALDPQPLRDALAGTNAEQFLSVDGAIDALAWRVGYAGLDGFGDGLDWLRANEPAEGSDAICHGDFHGNNILVDGERVSGVIDWSIAKIAPAEYDVGSTLMIMKLGPRDVPGLLDPAVGFLARSLARRYYAAYRNLRAGDEGAVRYYEALRCLQSLVWAGEHRVAVARGDDRGPNPWAAPRESKRLISHFRSISGVTIALPPAV